MIDVIVRTKLSDGSVAPSYKSQDAAGADVSSAETVTLQPSQRALVKTGVYLEVPYGYECQVRPRSGLALKGITVLNTPGTIDADYRGEVKVLLINLSEQQFTIERGDRIAQLVIAPVARAEFKIVEELSDTERGGGGFGSTGVK